MNNERIELNHHIEQWTDLIEHSTLNHVRAVIDKHIHRRKLRKCVTRRTIKAKRQEKLRRRQWQKWSNDLLHRLDLYVTHSQDDEDDDDETFG